MGNTLVCPTCSTRMYCRDTRAIKYVGHSEAKGIRIPALLSRERYCPSCGKTMRTYEIEVTDLVNGMREVQRQYRLALAFIQPILAFMTLLGNIKDVPATPPEIEFSGKSDMFGDSARTPKGDFDED